MLYFKEFLWMCKVVGINIGVIEESYKIKVRN